MKAIVDIANDIAKAALAVCGALVIIAVTLCGCSMLVTHTVNEMNKPAAACACGDSCECPVGSCCKRAE